MNANRVFVGALFISLILHVVFAILWVSKPTLSFKETDKKPIEVQMRRFALNQPPITAPVSAVPSPKTPSAVPKVDKEKTVLVEQNKPAKQATTKSAKQPAQPVQPELTETRLPEKTVNVVDLPQDALDATNPDVWDALLQTNQAAATPIHAQDLHSDMPVPEIKEAIRVEHPYDMIVPSDQPPFPHDALLRYQGPLSLTGTMHFERTENRYRIHTQLNIPFNKMEFISEGNIEGNQLMPLHYIHKRKGKVYASAVFDYDKNKVHYGKGETPQKEYAMQGQQLDYFSWAWQMSINGGMINNDVQLTNGKKAYFQPAPNRDIPLGKESQLDTGEGKIRLITLNIEREQNDKTDYISYGFAPDFANVPARITFNDGKTEYELNIIGIVLDQQTYWQAMRRVNRKER